MPGTIFLPGRNTGNTNNTTPVTLVAAPAINVQRMIKSLSVSNLDTANATVTVQLNGVDVTSPITLSPGDTQQFNENDLIVMSDVADTFTIVLGGAVTTNQLSFVVAWVDVG